MDDLNRLTDTKFGHLASGAISTASPNNRSGQETWTTLSQTGNWALYKHDRNGDGDVTDATDLDQTDTFNKANEILTLDGDSNSGTTNNNYNTVHNARGDMTRLSDGGGGSVITSSYTYDAFGRLVEEVLGSPRVKHRYNGLGYRIAMQYDADSDETMEDDERRYFAYDERWRVIASFKNASTYAKERYVHHAAGLGSPTLRGGSSSYIDSVVMRERDTTVPWTGSTASDSTLDERLYYAQNWRADVVAMLGTDADVKEWVHYTSYGVPWATPKGDYDLDGDVDAADTTALEAMGGGAGGWAVDFNHDTVNDGFDVLDHETYRTGYTGGTAGYGIQSRSGIDNTLGYAGYVWDSLMSANHVRHRVYIPSLGRWSRRDPFAQPESPSLYEYTLSRPLGRRDPTGEVSLDIGTTPTPINPVKCDARWKCADVDYLDCTFANRNDDRLIIQPTAADQRCIDQCTAWRNSLTADSFCTGNSSAVCNDRRGQGRG